MKSMIPVLVVGATLTVGGYGSGEPSQRNGERVALPDATPPLKPARLGNISDEYSMIVDRYGRPDSVVSTEHDAPTPKVATMTAIYNLAEVG